MDYTGVRAPPCPQVKGKMMRRRSAHLHPDHPALLKGQMNESGSITPTSESVGDRMLGWDVYTHTQVHQCACMCTCVRVRAHTHTHTHSLTLGHSSQIQGLFGQHLRGKGSPLLLGAVARLPGVPWVRGHRRPARELEIGCPCCDSRWDADLGS